MSDQPKFYYLHHWSTTETLLITTELEFAFLCINIMRYGVKIGDVNVIMTSLISYIRESMWI